MTELYEPPFHRAARLGDIPELERLLGDCDIDARIDLAVDNGPNLRGITPLMAAARSIDGADVSTLAWLLDHGADLYATSEGEVTAAWYSAGSGGRWEFHPWRLVPNHVDRLRFLLDAGLDPQETSFNGRSLLVEACGVGDPARVRLLLERNVPAIPVPASEDNVRLQVRAWGRPMQELFPPAAGSQFYSFQIPLFCAATSGSAECVQLLLDAGVDVNALDSGGDPALAYAGSPEVVRTLLTAGARFDLHDGSEDVLAKVLSGAACDGNLCGPGRFAVANALIDTGAPLEYTDKYGATRLYHAAF